jgi:hypothetical protein
MSQNANIYEKYGLTAPRPEDLLPLPGPSAQAPRPEPVTEWHMLRVGLLTCSQYSEVKLTAKGGFYQGTETYLDEKLAEWCTGSPTPNSAEYSKAVQWGKAHEQHALQAFQRLVKKKVTCWGEQQKFYQLKGCPLIGGTPDGLVGRDGVLEIKCPWNSGNHARTVRTAKVPDNYLDQVNGHLLLTGRKVCYFVSYDPRFAICPLMVVKVERDEEAILELKARLVKAQAELMDRLKRLKIDWRRLRRQRLESFRAQAQGTNHANIR